MAAGTDRDSGKGSGTPQTGIRLQKYLAAAGVCSRRRAEVLIQEGRVRINDAVVTQPGTRVDRETDRVTLDGNPVAPAEKKVYIALNKPRGYVTSCRHPGEQTVMALVTVPFRIFPVGRLDKDSTGLLLMTNDGPLHHRLSHPSFDHEKEYEVTVDQPIPDEALTALSRGVAIDGRMTRQAEVVRLSARRFRITLKEGRNRQIRRMVGRVGRLVVELKRVRVANIRLGRLSEGSWRYLSAAESAALRGRPPKPRREGGRRGRKPA